MRPLAHYWRMIRCSTVSQALAAGGDGRTVNGMGEVKAAVTVSPYLLR